MKELLRWYRAAVVLRRFRRLCDFWPTWDRMRAQNSEYAFRFYLSLATQGPPRSRLRPESLSIIRKSFF